MKTISMGFKNSLLKEINERTGDLKMTRAELIRNAIMEYLFRFDEIIDARLLAETIDQDEEKKSLEKIARELKMR